MSEPKRQRGQAEPQIRRRILRAIFEQRLPPGERLTEKLLASTFDVSRTVIRQVMARLEQDGILVKLPNRAASVAAPTGREVRQILAVRRMIEPEIVRGLAQTHDSISMDGLLAHLEDEDAARRSADRGTLVRLTGEFHLHLAELSQNAVLVRLMTGLQALTCLAILLYAHEDEACPPDEHQRIVAAIGKGDAELAARIMVRHLRHVEADLRLDDTRQQTTFSEALDWMRST